MKKQECLFEGLIWTLYLLQTAFIVFDTQSKFEFIDTPDKQSKVHDCLPSTSQKKGDGSIFHLSYQHPVCAHGHFEFDNRNKGSYKK